LVAQLGQLFGELLRLGLLRCFQSRHNEVAKAFDYMLKRIEVFTRFLEDGRICLSNNAAERELGCSQGPTAVASAPRSC
jgi:hypothetical protein